MLYLFVNHAASAGSFNLNEASGPWRRPAIRRPNSSLFLSGGLKLNHHLLDGLGLYRDHLYLNQPPVRR